MPGNAKRRQRKHRGTQTGSDQPTCGRPAAVPSGGDGAGQEPPRRSQGRQGRPRWSPRRPARPAADLEGRGDQAGVLFAAFLLPVSLLFGQPIAGAIVLTILAAIVYIPLGFETEQYFYNRRRVKLQREREAQQPEGEKGG